MVLHYNFFYFKCDDHSIPLGAAIRQGLIQENSELSDRSVFNKIAALIAASMCLVPAGVNCQTTPESRSVDGQPELGLRRHQHGNRFA